MGSVLNEEKQKVEEKKAGTDVEEAVEPLKELSRCHVVKNEDFTETAEDILAAYWIFLEYTFTFESLLVVLISIGSTLFYANYIDAEEDYIAAKLDLSVLSIAIVFPLTFLISHAFERREEALKEFATLRTLLVHVTMAFCNWNFQSAVSGDYNGRDLLPHDFEEQVESIVTTLITELHQFLQQPNVNRARHLILKRNGLKQGRILAEERLKKIAELFDRLYYCVEVMKERGLPPNEASRLNQYHWLAHSNILSIRNYKWYRTPQAARSFGRVYIQLLPWFYGPYYAWIVGRQESTEFSPGQVEPVSLSVASGTGVPFAVCLSVFTSVILIGLVNVQRLLEDPFLEIGIDAIRVSHDLAQTRDVVHQQCSLAIRRRKQRTKFTKENYTVQYDTSLLPNLQPVTR